MDKFERLIRFLENNKEQRLDLSFSEIEKINGEKLCKSAYTYEAYWQPSKTHVLPNYIIGCGYSITRVDLINKRIILTKK